MKADVTYTEADGRDVYSAPQAPLPPRSQPPWLRGLLLATLPSLVYFVFERWLLDSFVPGVVVFVLWCGVMVLTFYGVGVFVWSSKSRPTWGRAMVAVLVTGAWMSLVSFLVAVAAANIDLGR